MLEDGLGGGGAKDDGDDTPSDSAPGQVRTSVQKVRLRSSLIGRIKVSKAAGTMPPCFSRLSLIRARNRSRFHPDLATPMIGTSRWPRFTIACSDGKDLLVGQIARGAEEDQCVGTWGIHLLSLPSCRLLHVAAELEAHRREQLVLEVRLAARAEALVQGRGEDRRRHCLVDGGLDRPAPLARIGDAAGELRTASGSFDQRCRGQIEQPGGDHAAAPPDFGDVAQIEVVLVVLRIAQRRRLGVDRRAGCLPMLASRRMPSPSA